MLEEKQNEKKTATACLSREAHKRKGEENRKRRERNP